jgi:hypothetical protein
MHSRSSFGGYLAESVKARLQSDIADARLRRWSETMLGDHADYGEAFIYLRNVTIAQPQISTFLFSPRAERPLCNRPCLTESERKSPTPSKRTVIHNLRYDSRARTSRAASVSPKIGNLRNVNRGLPLRSDDPQNSWIRLIRIWANTETLNSDTTDRIPRLVSFCGKAFEAAVETCRRLIDVNSIRQTLSNLQTGAILGGSVSYGRFYNVTGAAPEFGSKSSDADLLLVLADYDQLASVVEKLVPIPGLEPSSLEQLRQRVTKFPQIRMQYAPCILSHKLKFWVNQSDSVLSGTKIPSEYSLSLHVFSLSDFDYMTLRDSSVLQPSEGASSFDRIIRDYRDTSPPESRAYDNRSFSGIALGTNPLEPVQVDLGYVAQVKVCLIQDDRYCPGLHQNLILPQFERRWESEQVRLYLRMLTFRWKILERLRTERTMRPFEEQKLSLSHVRYFVFSPHITHRADRD